MLTRCLVLLLVVIGSVAATIAAERSELERRLLSESPTRLAEDARLQGDPVQGAILFHGARLGCGKCHATGQGPATSLGPNLAAYDSPVSDADLIESVLSPSKTIRKGYEAVILLTASGRTHTGIVVRRTDQEVVLRSVDADASEIRIEGDQIEELISADVSLMPEGQVGQLRDRDEFLHLLRYLIEIRDGGTQRAEQLQPDAAQLALKLPEYESRVDHAGIISAWDRKAFARGKAVYEGLCVNCHGTRQQPGSLPTALRFGEGKFKHGSDPLAMYNTLTHGFGLMLPQPWMVPTQKYDVIHYIRETFLKPAGGEDYVRVTDAYLADLPKGDTRGPAPRKVEPWATMDYGPFLINTYEIGTGMENIAQKGIAVRLDEGLGGIARGRVWAVFDHDTMRLAGAWTGQGFIDWRGIHFNGNHGVHPHIVGTKILSNPDGPGWADPQTDSLDDDQRVIGRDGRRFGPLPDTWAQYEGLERSGGQTVVRYRVGATKVRERFGMISPQQSDSDSLPWITRTINLGPRTTDLSLVVATHPDSQAELTTQPQFVSLGTPGERSRERNRVSWDRNTYGRLDNSESFNLSDQDYTVVAKINTQSDGSIFSYTVPGKDWAPGGRTLFLRDGRLCFDIGWVGYVESNRVVANGKPWQVAVVWNAAQQTATLYIGGKASGTKRLAGKQPPGGAEIQLGYTAPNFPSADNAFEGQLSDVRFYQRALDPKELKRLEQSDPKALKAHWSGDALRKPDGGEPLLEDTSGNGHDLRIHDSGRSDVVGTVVAGLSTPIAGSQWYQDQGRLCLRLPAGEQPLKFVLWCGTSNAEERASLDVASLQSQLPTDVDLFERPPGDSRLWKQPVVTRVQRGRSGNAFEVDTLTAPTKNPWLARTRLTGLDFFADGDSLAVCSWDGDVWRVSGLRQLDASGEAELQWRRIASGLFQPLGLKIVDGRVFVGCRDQIVILNDRNGDGETDDYECFNDDHQVTEHFHEFAMGLQRDAEGNFYYAKSARHAKTALVPHHGTLLRVSPDGSKTDILAVGFRAANGVCLNPDGSFIVTDQEGHWNPKNRINWVTEGGFYGNMYGYHDVTDESDSAMQQPLCWITNAFDRSPAELLWVDSDRWGALNGKLLNLSYGYGKVFVVPHEFVDGQPQGGMCQLPIDSFPTGVMRGRFSPHDGQLYLCGMFAWGSNQQMQEGGLYRVRYTGDEALLPIGLNARPGEIQIDWSDPIDREFATDPEHYRVKVWSLKRTANYGSEHYNEHELAVRHVKVDPQGRALILKIPDLEPTWCMEIVANVKGRDGRVHQRVIHNTVHELRQPE
ncbi:heme-binding protein [Roseiconus nitratireducens]|uniref:Heme-binding protein n=1 Tax=Roseiconus nitratireducens TaxID=2605748 RepID=A0A5M6D406_9BACT|nr:DUF6797 domain-containing protein [Roseiconus nitratireducens]KAA5540469.1 heme-binding protein [Roseiconus nitratireducens]